MFFPERFLDSSVDFKGQDFELICLVVEEGDVPVSTQQGG